jgi:uncharacterized protein (DUF983 family)
MWGSRRCKMQMDGLESTRGGLLLVVLVVGVVVVGAAVG